MNWTYSSADNCLRQRSKFFFVWNGAICETITVILPEWKSESAADDYN